MNISATENLNTSLNTSQQPPITTQPHQNQIHNYSNNKQHFSSYQPTSSATNTGQQQHQQHQLSNSGLSGQMNKKQGLQNQLNQMNKNQKPSNTNNQTNSTTSGYRKIFIQRDYSEGTSVRFQNKFPEELEGYIERQHFDYLITTLNCYYDKAEAANLSTFCEGFCACLTAYLIYICVESHYEKYMRKTKEYINEQNDKVWKPRGLFVTDPIDRGLRILEITIGPKAQQKTMIPKEMLINNDQFKIE